MDAGEHQEGPGGYLTWALAEVGKTQDKLQASELSLKTKKNATARAWRSTLPKSRSMRSCCPSSRMPTARPKPTRSGRPAFTAPNSTKCT